MGNVGIYFGGTLYWTYSCFGFTDSKQNFVDVSASARYGVPPNYLYCCLCLSQPRAIPRFDLRLFEHIFESLA